MRQYLRLLILGLIFLPAALPAKKASTSINVIPYPQSVVTGKGYFKGAGANFNCDPEIDNESVRLIREFAERIKFVTGRTNSFASPVGMIA